MRFSCIYRHSTYYLIFAIYFLLKFLRIKFHLKFRCSTGFYYLLHLSMMINSFETLIILIKLLSPLPTCFPSFLSNANLISISLIYYSGCGWKLAVNQFLQKISPRVSPSTPQSAVKRVTMLHETWGRWRPSVC